MRCVPPAALRASRRSSTSRACGREGYRPSIAVRKAAAFWVALPSIRRTRRPPASAMRTVGTSFTRNARNTSARLAPRQREAVDCGLQRISAWYERWRDMMSTISTKHGAKIYYNMGNEDLLGFLKT